MLATETPVQHRYEITLFDLFFTLFRRKRWIIAAGALGVGVGVLLALITPAQYRADTRIAPSSSLSTSSDLGRLTQISDALGMDLGGARTDISPLIPEFLSSREVQEALLARRYPARDGHEADLATALGIKARNPALTTELARRHLRQVLRSSTDSKSGATTISLTLPDPVLAAAVLNAAVEEMNRRIETLRSGQAGGKVRFISQRLEEVRGKLNDAEAALVDFREGNRRIEDSPQLQLQEARLTREVTLNEQVFVTLKTQYELARIDQYRDLPDVVVLDEAVPPVERASPHRAAMVVISTLIFGVLAVAGVFLFEVGRNWIAALESRRSPLAN